MKSKLQQYVCIETLQRRRPLATGETVEEGGEVEPIIEAISNKTVEELDSLVFSVSLSAGTDTEECPVVWSLIGAPAWITIDEDTGEITIEPPAGKFNNGLAWTMQVCAENCAGSNLKTLNVFVTPLLGIYKGQFLSSNVPTAFQIQSDPRIVFDPASTAFPSDDWEADVPQTGFTGAAGEYEFAALGSPLHKQWIARPVEPGFEFTSMTVNGFPWAITPAANTPYCVFTSNGTTWHLYLTSNSNGGGFNLGGGNPLTIA